MECRLRRTTVLVLLHSSLLFAKICDFGVLTLAAAALDLAHWIFVPAARSLTTEALASGCPGLTSLEPRDNSQIPGIGVQALLLQPEL